jgi:hypothetical protein
MVYEFTHTGLHIEAGVNSHPACILARPPNNGPTITMILPNPDAAFPNPSIHIVLSPASNILSPVEALATLSLDQFLDIAEVTCR